VIATLVAVLLIGGYLLFLSDLFKVVPGATDATWVRYTDIRTGLEALVFAAAGALFGTAVQRQVTSGVETDLANANAAVDELDSTLEHVVDEAAAGRLVAIEPTKSTEVLQRALLEDNALFLAAPQRLVDHARDLSLEAQSQPRDLVARIRGSQSRAVLLRTRRR
jgi:hypothetical protein